MEAKNNETNNYKRNYEKQIHPKIGKLEKGVLFSVTYDFEFHKFSECKKCRDPWITFQH